MGEIRLLAPKHAAQALDLSVSRLAQLDRIGRLPAVRDSAGRRMWAADAVDAYRREREAAIRAAARRALRAAPLAVGV